MTKVAKTIVGCLGMLAVWAGTALALHLWLASRVDDTYRPLFGIASGMFFTLAAFTVWTIVSGISGGDLSRGAILARAKSGRLPTEDGVAVYEGTTRPERETLQSPISGTPCVAYFYRMYELVYDAGSSRARNEVPHYWGFGSVPFFVDTPSSAVRVLAMPKLDDEGVHLEGPDEVARAQRWITSNPFENAAGIGGMFATVYEITSDVLTEHGAQRRNFRRTDTTRSAASLRLEESIVPVGTRVTVSGAWSTRHNGIVPGSAIDHDNATGMGVTVTTRPLARVGGTQLGVPTSTTYNIVFAIVTAAIGAGILWAGITYAARPQ